MLEKTCGANPAPFQRRWPSVPPPAGKEVREQFIRHYVERWRLAVAAPPMSFGSHDGLGRVAASDPPKRHCATIGRARKPFSPR